MPAHDNHLALLPTADPPVIRCKTCKASLPDTTWKNCANCRKNRTESYHRWKKSKLMGTIDLTTSANSATSLQAPGPTAPRNHYPNVEPNHYGNPSWSSWSSPRLADDQPQLTSASTVPQPQPQPQPQPPPSKPIEYQWSDELIEALLALPPRSGYLGKFSVIADPTVNNSTRARLFTSQLHARAVRISDQSQPISLDTGSSNSFSRLSYCTCEEGCQGRVVISVDDDLSHPYGVPGQRICVAVVHPGRPC